MAETHNAQRSEMASSARAARLCTRCEKNPLSYNNTTGVCGECQRSTAAGLAPKKTNGHKAVAAQRPAPHLVKPNGADRDNPVPRDGTGAHRAEDRSVLPGAPAESRVNLLLAALPAAEKAKLLCAWLHGTL
jgi:hypothetical protein